MIVGVDGHLIRHSDNAVEEITESQVKDEDSVGSCHLEVVKGVTMVKVASWPCLIKEAVKTIRPVNELYNCIGYGPWGTI